MPSRIWTPGLRRSTVPLPKWFKRGRTAGRQRDRDADGLAGQNLVAIVISTIGHDIEGHGSHRAAPRVSGLSRSDLVVCWACSVAWR